MAFRTVVPSDHRLCITPHPADCKDEVVWTALPVWVATPPPTTDQLLASISADGASLAYSTYLTGAGALDVDTSGDAYVAGVALRGFPVTSGAFEQCYGANVSQPHSTATSLAPAGVHPGGLNPLLGWCGREQLQTSPGLTSKRLLPHYQRVAVDGTVATGRTIILRAGGRRRALDNHLIFNGLREVPCTKRVPF